MALVQNLRTGAICALEPEHVVGRSGRSSLRLEASYVSAQHACIRWVGDGWEIKDLGSRNGTLVDGTPLKPGQAMKLLQGSKVSFGRGEQTWELVDDSPPRAMVVPLDGTTRPVPIEGDMVVLPSPEDPRVTVFRAPDGSWKLEREDSIDPIAVGQDFQIDEQSFRLSCPAVMPGTSTTEWPEFAARNLRNLQLKFRVSTDEEHVELSVQKGSETVELGSRLHNYLLLVLARRRLEETAAGAAEAASGWIYQDDLLSALKIGPERLNIDVFRIRKQFSSIGIQDAANVIERRPSSKQLRLGVGAVTIHRV